MRARFTAAPGESLQAISLPGEFTRGIEIDNPSGSWLYIPTLETFIAPYTLAWAFTFAYDVASIDVLARDGPAGQVSTQAGDPITVYLSSETVGSSAGMPAPDAFIRQFTPVLSAIDIHNNTFPAAFLRTIVAAIPNRRFRIRTMNVALIIGSTGATNVSPTTITIGPGGVLPSPVIILGQWEPTHDYLFPNGFDLPVNTDIVWSGNSLWQDETVQAFVTYEVI